MSMDYTLCMLLLLSFITGQIIPDKASGFCCFILLYVENVVYLFILFLTLFLLDIELRKIRKYGIKIATITINTLRQSGNYKNHLI
jgi:hypothetical protein